MSQMSRRVVVLGSLAAALTVPMIAQAQNKKLKVAAIYTVPAGHTFFLWRIDIFTSLNGNDFATYQNKTVSPTGVVQLTQQAPFPTSYNVRRMMPRPFTEKTDIQLMAKIQTGTGAVSISQEGILIKGAAAGAPGVPWI